MQQRVVPVRVREGYSVVIGSDMLAHSGRLLRETLGNPLGFYTSFVGPQNQFVHLWGYESLAEYERRSRLRDAHPDFAAYLKASEPYIVAQETRLIRATAMPSLAG